MKKLLFLLFIPSICLAEGPIFRHKEPEKQQEFENVYQDIRSQTNKYIKNISSQPSVTQEFSVNTGTANYYTAPRSNTQIQYGVNESNSGMKILANDQVTFLSRGTTSYLNNATGQNISAYDGTACLPSWTWKIDSGTGLFLPVSDAMGFGIGCSTSALMKQVDLADKTDTVPFTVYGASTTTQGKNSFTEFHIFTATVTTTPNQVAQINQAGALVVCSGRDTASSNYFTDLLLSSFFLPNPTVVAAHTDLGTPATRTYSSGGGSTGIMRLAMSSGNYLVECFSLQNFGK